MHPRSSGTPIGSAGTPPPGQPRLVAPPRRRPAFHRLTIRAVEHLTPRAVAITFEVPAALRHVFAFEPGQYLTLRAEIDGVDVRRSYSICTSAIIYAESGRLRVASARVPHGSMSNWLGDQARVGNTVDVLPPLGDFAASVFGQASEQVSTRTARHYVAIAAGSGITPIMSIIGTALQTEPQAEVTLLYGNRNVESIMFRDELRALQLDHPRRLRVLHVLSMEPSDGGHLVGRIDQARMTSFIEDVVPVAGVDEWFVCGPHPMVRTVLEVLEEAGADPSRVHQEIFHLER